MEMFNHVMVLASIIVGLAITHLLQGVAGIVVHPKRNKLYWVHLVWVAWLFVFAAFWWWWEFRLSMIQTWTLGLYLFVLFYAVLLYVGSALLFPSDLQGYDGFKHYFYSRRRWIFGIIIATGLADLVDTILKGWEHFASQGLLYPLYVGPFLTLAVAAMITRNERFHGVFAVVAIVGQLVLAVINYNVVQ